MAQTNAVNDPRQDGRAVEVSKDGYLVIIHGSEFQLKTRITAIEALELARGQMFQRAGVIVQRSKIRGYGWTGELRFFYDIGPKDENRDHLTIVTRRGLRAAARRAGIKI